MQTRKRKAEALRSFAVQTVMQVEMLLAAVATFLTVQEHVACWTVAKIWKRALQVRTSWWKPSISCEVWQSRMALVPFERIQASSFWPDLPLRFADCVRVLDVSAVWWPLASFSNLEELSFLVFPNTSQPWPTTLRKVVAACTELPPDFNWGTKLPALKHLEIATTVASCSGFPASLQVLYIGNWTGDYKDFAVFSQLRALDLHVLSEALDWKLLDLPALSSLCELHLSTPYHNLPGDAMPMSLRTISLSSSLTVLELTGCELVINLCEVLAHCTQLLCLDVNNSWLRVDTSASSLAHPLEKLSLVDNKISHAGVGHWWQGLQALQWVMWGSIVEDERTEGLLDTILALPINEFCRMLPFERKLGDRIRLHPTLRKISHVEYKNFESHFIKRHVCNYGF